MYSSVRAFQFSYWTVFPRAFHTLIALQHTRNVGPPGRLEVLSTTRPKAAWPGGFPREPPYSCLHQGAFDHRLCIINMSLDSADVDSDVELAIAEQEDAKLEADAMAMPEPAEEDGAQAPVEKMTLADWHNLKAPEVAAKFRLSHLKEFLASLPQAPAEDIPETLVVGQVTWDGEKPRIALGRKVQGPHGIPGEGDTESPLDAALRELHYAWVCTFSCPTEETMKEKKLKKPGEFTRYQIMKAVLSAVAKTNEQPSVTDRAKQVQGTL